MKHCKGGCGKRLGLMQGNYCEECKDKLPLHKKLIEEGWKDSSYNIDEGRRMF